MEKQNNLENCVFLKTILMFFVILGHACAFWSGHWFTENPAIQSFSLNILYVWVNSFHIYAFTMISGYIFAFKVLSGDYCEYIPFLCDKTKRLIVPYAFIAIIWVAPISAFFFNWNLSYVVMKFLFAINPSQLWFLWMLFGVFVIIWPIRMILINKPIVGWLISLISYGIGILGKRMLPNIFCVWSSCQYVMFFFIGLRILVKEEKREKLIVELLPCYLWIVLDSLIFVVGIIVERNSAALWNLIAIGHNMLLHIVGAIMAWTTLQGFADKVDWKNCRAFKIISSCAMPMYLFHQQIIYFTIVWLNGVVNPWINAGVNFIVALLGSFIISEVLMRWKWTRFLIGEKPI